MVPPSAPPRLRATHRSRNCRIDSALQINAFVSLLLFPAVSAASADQALPAQGSPPVIAAPDASLSSTPAPAAVPPVPPPNSIGTTPSFYGASDRSGTESIGIPQFATSPFAPLQSLLENPLRWGPFTAHPHVDYVFTYASGVLNGPGNQIDTARHALSPGLTVTSPHLTFGYTPTLTYYTKGPYEDSLDHNASLNANFGYDDWRFGIEQTYSNSNRPLIETGTQTQTELITTGLAASWFLNEKWFFDFSVSQQFQEAQGFQSSKRWSTMEWANYRITRQLSIGAGVGGGYSDVDLGSDSWFEQIQGRLGWFPSAKLNLNLNGGIEIRQFVDRPDSDSLVTPIMGAGLTYRPFDNTSFFLHANRSVNPSLFADQITETTSVTGGVNQRLLGRFNLGLTAGFRSTDFRGTGSTSAGFPSQRQDDYTFVSTTIGTRFLKRGSASLGFQHNINESSRPGFTYDSNQFTASIGYRF